MIKPINNKFLLILIISGLIYYLFKYPIEHLDNKCNSCDSQLALLQLLQLKIKDLKDSMDKTNSKISIIESDTNKNTNYIKKMNSQINQMNIKFK